MVAKGIGTAVGLALGLLTGCGEHAVSAPEHQSGIVITDGRGASVRLERPAENAVSLAPSCTEIVAEVAGLEPLLAVTRYCDDPPGAESLPKTEGFDSPSVEALLALDPDVVFASAITRPHTVERLRSAGLTVMVLAGEGLDGLANDLRIAARALGVDATPAVQTFQSARNRVASALDGLAAGERPRLLVTFGALETFSASEGTFTDALIREAGAQNAAIGTPSQWPRLTLETIVLRNPEVIVVTAEAVNGIEPVPPELLKRYRDHPVWSQVAAVRSGRVWQVDSDTFTVPSPAVAELLVALAQRLHPERFESAGSDL
ncbi:MAG: ABC transporter substrate-binding protein [Opitutales bacterium]